jgi:hypothetical protein
MKSPGDLFLHAFHVSDLDLYINSAPDEPRRVEAANKAATEYDRARAQLAADVEAFVQEVEARASKATPGPWEPKEWFCSESEGGWAAVGPHHVADDGETCGGDEAHVEAKQDAQFIANAREDVSRLVAIVREQGARIAEFDEAQKQERIEWACMVSAWGCYHSDPASFLPYVKICLSNLSKRGVPDWLTGPMYPHADGRVGSENDDKQGDVVRELLVRRSEVAALRERLAKLEKALTHAVNHLDEANDIIELGGLRDDDEGVDEVRAWIETTRAELLNDSAKGGA